MKLLIALLFLSLLPCKSYADDTRVSFSTMNGKQIILLTAKERENIDGFEDLTEQRAVNACKFIDKELISYQFVEAEPIRHELSMFILPTKNSLRSVTWNEADTHIHDGAAWLSVLVLTPIVIPYTTRVATEIVCDDTKGKASNIIVK